MKITQSFIFFVLLFAVQIDASNAVKNQETSNQPEKATECSLCIKIAPALQALVKGNCLGVPGVDLTECKFASTIIGPHIIVSTLFLSQSDEISKRARDLLIAQSVYDNESVRKYMEKGVIAYSSVLPKPVSPFSEDTLTDEQLPQLMAVLEKQSCTDVDKETCEKAKQLLFRCQATLWFTLSGDAGKATRSLLVESPEEDAKVLAMMKHMNEQSNQIDEKLTQELKNYK
jgi:hypothetical protein